MNINKSSSQNIEGYVEIIACDTVYGWVTVDSNQFSLSVLLNGLIVGVADDFLVREDLTAKPLARGFCIKCEKHVTPADLVGGRLQVVAMGSHNIVSLPVWRPLQEAGVLLNIDLPELRKALSSVPAAYRKNLIRELGFSQAGRSFGRLSDDGLAQVGRNGYLFLVSGRNHLSKIYTGEVVLDIDKWVTCFANRQEQLKRREVRYVQVMIPEKTSVFYDYAPYTATAGSAPYLDLIRLSLEKEIPICDVLPDLLAAKVESSVYPQGDTHLSTLGAEVVVRAILDVLNERAIYTPAKTARHLRVGDLSERFAEDGDIQEFVPMYETLYFDGIESKVDLIRSVDPETGHQGRQRVWRNHTAPIKKKVVCFGNSFFERGENSGYLSWWFARLFSEFHFIWSPDLDVSYVESVLPDIVICQTIERFLTELPAQ
ncbi:alginate O-acetyltransferase AlgX-related protein [Massilia timonae]|uniref:alginate O-acetyltransferase AlgX-related protein n=1 Tax=Massilia timonae TaxID=47229 RepID=UPI002352D076|nr:hypothetical protein [Massilia timonae]